MRTFRKVVFALFTCSPLAATTPMSGHPRAWMRRPCRAPRFDLPLAAGADLHPTRRGPAKEKTMRHDGSHSVLTMVACFTITILSLLAAPGLAGERSALTYSIAAATSPIYDYRIDEFSFGSYPESVEPRLSVGG